MVVRSSFFRHFLLPSSSSSPLWWNCSLSSSSPFQCRRRPSPQSASPNRNPKPSSSVSRLTQPPDVNSTHNNSLVFNFYRFDRSKSYPELCNDAIYQGSSHGSLAFGILRLGQIGVFKSQSASNQRHKTSLVGTSETAPATTYPKSFCEWLAGIIDGDGSLQVNNSGQTSLEITMGLEDIRLLRYVQHMLGGSIKMRAGAKAYRYRLRDQIGMIKLMNCINGHIRKSARLVQLHRVCQVHDIPVILPIALDARSNWFAGFFDANGNIDITMKNQLPQLSIRVASKLLQDVEPYKVVFGGNIYFDSGRNGYYEWFLQSREDVEKIVDYFKSKSTTWRSQKSRRFFLIDEYYSLYDLKAYEPSSMNHKAWLAFLDKWNNMVT